MIKYITLDKVVAYVLTNGFQTVAKCSPESCTQDKHWGKSTSWNLATKGRNIKDEFEDDVDDEIEEDCWVGPYTSIYVRVIEDVNIPLPTSSSTTLKKSLTIFLSPKRMN